MNHLIVFLLFLVVSFKYSFEKVSPESFMMFVVVFTILFSGYIFFYKIYAAMNLKKLKKEEFDTIERYVKEAYFGDYTNLNNYIKSKGELKIIKICYFIHRSSKGSWLDMNELEYPQIWGDNFFELAMSYFEKFPTDYEDLSDMLNQSTFLATVKPEIMKQVCDKI